MASGGEKKGRASDSAVGVMPRVSSSSSVAVLTAVVNSRGEASTALTFLVLTDSPNRDDWREGHSWGSRLAELAPGAAAVSSLLFLLPTAFLVLPPPDDDTILTIEGTLAAVALLSYKLRLQLKIFCLFLHLLCWYWCLLYCTYCVLYVV